MRITTQEPGMVAIAQAIDAIITKTISGATPLYDMEISIDNNMVRKAIVKIIQDFDEPTLESFVHYVMNSVRGTELTLET